MNNKAPLKARLGALGALALLSMGTVLLTQPTPAAAAPVAQTATASPVLGMFVPCAALGRGYAEIGSSNDMPGLFFYECDSPSAPTVLQMIYEEAVPGLANAVFQRSIAQNLDPQSSINQSPGIGPWFEISSSGPPGSRPFKRLYQAPRTNRQIDIYVLKGRYVASVMLTFHKDSDGQGENTPARAGEILTTLLARIPS